MGNRDNPPSYNVIQGNFGSGGGPEDPMLDARVRALEEAVARVDARLGAVQNDLTDIKMSLVSLDAKLDGKLGAIEGRLSGIEGRIGSVEGRFNQVPTIWGMLGIVATLLIGVAGLIFTAGKFFRP